MCFLGIQRDHHVPSRKKHHLGLILHIGTGQNQKHFGPRMSSYVIVLTILFSTHTYVQQAVTTLPLQKSSFWDVYPVTMRVQHLSVILRDTMCDLANKMVATSGYNGMELDTMGCNEICQDLCICICISLWEPLFVSRVFYSREQQCRSPVRNNPWHKPPYLGPQNEEIQYTIFSGVLYVMCLNNVIFSTHFPGNGKFLPPIYLWWRLGDGKHGIVLTTLVVFKGWDLCNWDGMDAPLLYRFSKRPPHRA